jgi:hypothetical protein
MEPETAGFRRSPGVLLKGSNGRIALKNPLGPTRGMTVAMASRRDEMGLFASCGEDRRKGDELRQLPEIFAVGKIEVDLVAQPPF